jgi:hydrogenase maturation factor
MPTAASDVPEAAATSVVGKGVGDGVEIGSWEGVGLYEGVAMQTTVGGKRIIARLVGDPVPRIC